MSLFEAQMKKVIGKCTEEMATDNVGQSKI